jgi:hypothetical protein
VVAIGRWMNGAEMFTGARSLTGSPVPDAGGFVPQAGRTRGK